jgi:fluoride ion exporter CrcB/FEX
MVVGSPPSCGVSCVHHAFALLAYTKFHDPSQYDMNVIMVMDSIGTGFSGCCSTVSTMMTDTIKLFPTDKSTPPNNVYRYALGTIVTAAAITLIVYSSIKNGLDDSHDD